jgi:hypothetical protein
MLLALPLTTSTSKSARYTRRVFEPTLTLYCTRAAIMWMESCSIRRGIKLSVIDDREIAVYTYSRQRTDVLAVSEADWSDEDGSGILPRKMIWIGRSNQQTQETRCETQAK